MTQTKIVVKNGEILSDGDAIEAIKIKRLAHTYSAFDADGKFIGEASRDNAIRLVVDTAWAVIVLGNSTIDKQRGAR